MVPDGRAIMFRSREECDQYEKFYGIKIPGAVLAERMSLQYHMNTVYASKRPIGSTIIYATHDNMKGHAHWMIEPSG